MVHQRLMAIWKYDDKLGYLCGEVKKFLSKGYVSVEGYDGLYFKPILILPYDEECITKLNSLKDDLDFKISALITEYKNTFEDYVGLEKTKEKEG